MKQISAHSFKIVQGPIRKMIIFFLPPSPSSLPWKRRGGGRGRAIRSGVEHGRGVERGARPSRSSSPPPGERREREALHERESKKQENPRCNNGGGLT
jgi:hypothetical protein